MLAHKLFDLIRLGSKQSDWHWLHVRSLECNHQWLDQRACLLLVKAQLLPLRAQRHQAVQLLQPLKFLLSLQFQKDHQKKKAKGNPNEELQKT